MVKIGIIKKLTTNEQVRDIEKVGLAGSSLAPVCLRVKVGILIPDILWALISHNPSSQTSRQESE